MNAPATRRAFLASSASAVAAVAAGPSAARVAPRPQLSGPVYGRTGSRGFAPGAASSPSRGEVIILDGRVLEASHVTSRGIGAGKSVFLVPDGDEGWSILYAEC